ncbi:hypothetical protein [Aquimarina agarilytica]|uniref:hypothetical protein n=1 Tax=Aquimarina agarilytica TaxID=1087449 RepID=UPI00028919BC|nr:hypothetical protein [Aquimarina agarilytica]
MERIQKRPFPRGNTADILNYLEELILLQAKEEGYFPISEALGGYQDIEITATQAVSLQVPQKAVSAVLVLEADSTSSSFVRIVRFKENGSAPTASSGFALGDNDIYSIVGKNNLENFKVIGIEKDKKHIGRIQFFETNQFKFKL